MDTGTRIHTRTRAGPPTLDTVSGVLKSRPPTSRKPHGDGPVSVTVWLMLPGVCGRSPGRRGRPGGYIHGP